MTRAKKNTGTRSRIKVIVHKKTDFSCDCIGYIEYFDKLFAVGSFLLLSLLYVSLGLLWLSFFC